jgi:hypothetical protein
MATSEAEKYSISRKREKKLIIEYQRMIKNCIRVFQFPSSEDFLNASGDEIFFLVAMRDVEI